MTRQLVTDRARIGRIVELGSGSGGYLRFVGGLFALELRGSDLPGPRLDRARQEHPDLMFDSGDALAIVRKYGSRATRFLATFVMGNLTSAEIEELFELITSKRASLTFCAKGRRHRTPNLDVSTPDNPYHDYFALIDGAGLSIVHQQIRASRSDPSASIYVMTVTA